MPTSYADITLGQYQRVAKLLREKRILESNEDKIDFDCELLSILTGVDEGVFYAIPYSEYVKLIGKLSFLTEIPKAKMVHTLSINNKPYTVLNSVKDISAGDFIDLQEYQKNVDDNMHMILATLVRGEEWNSNNVPELAKHFQEKLTAEQAIGVALFLQRIHQLRSAYRGLFPSNNGATEEDDKSNNSKWFTSKYGWLVWVDKLADGKRKDWDYFLNMGVIEFLNSITYSIDKFNYEKANERAK